MRPAGARPSERAVPSAARGWQRVRRVGRRLVADLLVERLRGWRARVDRVPDARPARSADDPHAVRRRGEAERIYWNVASLLHAVLGHGRMRVRMAPDDPQSVDVRDTRTGFHGVVRVAPDGRGTEALALDAGNARSLGSFQKPPQAVHALLRSLLEHAEARQSEATPAALRRVWLPLEEGRPVPRLLRVGSQWSNALHRSGWAAAMETVASLHDERGVLFDGFLEATFCWRDTGRIHETPWVGVCHVPPDAPAWTGTTNDDLFAGERFRRSLPHCRGLFALSESHRVSLRERVDVPVSVIPLPTDVPPQTFSMEAFRQNPRPRLVQIGHWLRDPNSLYRLRVPGLRKTRLDVGHPWEEGVRQHLPPQEPLDLASVEVMPHLPDAEYDALLAQNLVFLHLLGSSANNAVAECIVRATPLLVNPLPAVVEHLGRDYPLYFETLEEAERKAGDPKLVDRAHRHLQEMPAERFSRETFLARVVDSEVYRALRAERPALQRPT